jgi:RecB family endonuclease NucS
MKLIIADCSATYTGRGDSELARGVRMVMVKTDGSVSIHNDKSNKPVNYMKSASQVDSINHAGEDVWTFDTRQESLTITLHKILSVFENELIAEDAGAVKDGTEKHLQDWLIKHPEVLGEGFKVIAREYQTGEGPVDLLAVDANNRPIAVEVKRVAALGAVDQCRRYIDALQTTDLDQELGVYFANVGAMLAAVDIRPKTLAWAIKHNIQTVNIPTNWKEID